MIVKKQLTLIWKILCVFALQILFFTYMIGEKQLILAYGEEIRLKVLPLDPRSLFRGDYVILQYSIQQIPQELLASKRPPKSLKVYTLLEKQEEEEKEEEQQTWKAVSVHFSIPKTKKNQIFLKGHLDRQTFKELQSTNYSSSKNMKIHYGIETYFVPEGQGKKLEQLRDQKRITIGIRVNSKGKAVIQTLFIDDLPQHQETLF